MTEDLDGEETPSEYEKYKRQSAVSEWGPSS